MIASPNTAHVKQSTRRPNVLDTSRNASRDVSVQPLPPASRRASQQQISRDGSTALTAPHPYAAAPSPNAYHRPGTGGSYAPNGQSGSLAALANGGSTGALNGNAYGNGNGNGNGNGTASDSFRHSQAAGTQGKKNGDAREGALSPREGRANGMAVYDREQMARVGEQDEDGHGGGRKKGGFWSLFCCRA